MGQRKAGKSILPHGRREPDVKLTLIMTHPDRCEPWWMALHAFVESMPPGPQAFWKTVLKNRVVPIDPAVGDAILSDARRWPGWSEVNGPLEVRTLSAGETQTLIARYEADGQGAVATGLRELLKRSQRGG